MPSNIFNITFFMELQTHIQSNENKNINNNNETIKMLHIISSISIFIISNNYFAIGQNIALVLICYAYFHFRWALKKEHRAW